MSRQKKKRFKKSRDLNIYLNLIGEGMKLITKVKGSKKRESNRFKHKKDIFEY